MPGAARSDSAGRRLTHQNEIDGTLVRHPPEVLLTDDTDGEEIRELVIDSYRILAPKKLTALLD
jgi:hypothetical protein